jgi:SAM-dependent methyltransferase
VKFLDAGCGIGNVLFAASCFGLGNKYVGLEYFDKVADIAEMFLGLKNNSPPSDSIFEVRRRDITKYRHYNQYDFIYYFHPLSDGVKEKEFERRVEDQMKVGAILIAIMKGDDHIRKDKRFKKIIENVWEKI